MENELIKEKVIDYVLYSEYRLLDMEPDNNGKYRTELRIKILKSTISVKNILEKWSNMNPDRSITQFTRVVITFGFPIKPINELGTYQSVDVYAFDLNSVKNIGELTTVWVENPDLSHRINLSVNLNDDFTNLQYMKLLGCDLRKGLEIFNKNSLVMELVYCDITEGIQQYENRPNKKNTVYCLLTSCQFHNLRGINVDKIKLFTLKGCSFDSVFNSGKKQMMDNLVPTLSFKNSDQIIIEDLFVRTILTGLEFEKIDNLRVAGFHGKEPVIDKTLKNSIIASECKEVTFTRISVPGISVDKCETVNISNVNIGQTVAQNAHFAVKAMRCTGKISISNIECAWNTVQTAIAISLCKTEDGGAISICECNFKKLRKGIVLNTNSGNINICNCSFKDMDRLAEGLTVKSHAGSVKVIDSQFGPIETGNIFTACENIDFVDCVFDGEATPKEDKIDLRIIESGNIRFIHTQFQSMHLSIKNCVNTTIQKSSLKTDILRLEGSDLSIEDSLVTSCLKSMFTTGNLLNLRYTTFETYMPEFDNYEKVLIDDCVFSKGIKLTTCGSASSYIKESDFGTPGNPKVFSKGIQLSSCSGIEMSKNEFHTKDESEIFIVEIVRCNSCVFDHTNVYKAQSRISIIDWAKESEIGLNNNHIIIDSQSKTQPIVSATNNFRYMLFIYNRKLYQSQYGDIQAYKDIKDVLKLKLNTVSIVNFNDLWVPPYIKSLNTTIKAGLNQIS